MTSCALEMDSRAPGQRVVRATVARQLDLESRQVVWREGRDLRAVMMRRRARKAKAQTGMVGVSVARSVRVISAESVLSPVALTEVTT